MQPTAHTRRLRARRLSCVRRHACALALCGAGLATVAVPVQAQTAEGVNVLPARVRLGLEKIDLPEGERMGLAGTTYLIEVGRGFALGPAAYGAVSGERGGLFTFGGEAAWRHPITSSLAVELGFYAGGGGGGSAPVGSGLMLRPHADLLWRSGRHGIGLSWSRVRFPDGRIDSSQVGLVWTLETEFRHVDASRASSRTSVGGRTGAGFDRIQAVTTLYRTQGGSTRVDGSPLSRNIGLVGVRAEHAFDYRGELQTYWGAEAAGAAAGGVGGYAEYLGTLGAEFPVSRRLTLGARVALGSGGGGEVDTGGGLLMKAAAYGIVPLGREFGLTLEGGLVRAPQGSLKAYHVSAALVWVLDDPADTMSSVPIVRSEFAAGLSRYPAARRDGSVRDLQSVVLKINRDLTPSWYLTGQAHSALGGEAGGYSAGFFGLGWQHAFGGGWRVSAEMLAGAAAGGGVDTRGGAVVQPMAYVSRDLGSTAALRVGVGRIKSVRGELDGTVADVSLVLPFGVGRR